MKLGKKTLAITTAGIIGLGAITAPIFADGGRNCGGKGGYSMMGGHHMGKNTDRMIGKMAKKLDMTEEQRNQAFETADEYRPKFRELKFALKDNMNDLHDMDSNVDDYSTKTAELADQQGDLVAEMIKLKTSMHADIEAILTDEQKVKFEKFKQRKRGHHKDRDGDKSDS